MPRTKAPVPTPKVISVKFFRTDQGNEPVREWLKALPDAQRKTLGEDIRTVEWGWPIGMPLVEKLEKDLWEVRSHLEDGIARVFFSLVDGQMVLLHGFKKKSMKIPQDELKLARKRMKQLRS